ncbi:MAG TPA: hypothetical protein VFC42_13255 [Methylomirabilota bacterium]|nr:hypothetical protein [Methylomirabilota bacterium]
MQPRALSHRLSELLAALAGSGLLFWHVARHSAFIHFDSGPYLSLAHNLAAHGRLVSNFDFVGNFESLPGVPNFVPPGLGLLIGLLQPLTGDLLAAGKVALFACLVLTQLLATRLVARGTGDRAYALVAAGLLVWDPRSASLAGSILTELPFIACLLGATLAAVVVLEAESSGRRARLAKWLGLPAASSLLCLTRYLGVFFPLTLSALYLMRAAQTPAPRRPRLGAAAGYLAFYGAAALGPTALWLAAARLGGAPLVPDRPPSLLSVPAALEDAARFAAAWAAPWVVVGGSLLIASRATRRRPDPADRHTRTAEWFLGTAALAYLALLVVVRTRIALFPFRSLGTRYVLPAWPLVTLLGALLFHRLVWAPGDGRVRRLAAAAAVLAFAVQGAFVLGAKPQGLPFPMETHTYRAALGLVGSRDVVLMNYGQLLCAARPEARVISVPSRVQFDYALDLPALAARHGVRWVIVFDVPEKRQSFPDLASWLDAPPAGVRVAGAWRFDDGVIYELARPRTEGSRPGRSAAEGGLGARIDPRTQLVQGRTVCVVSCQRFPKAQASA